MAVQDSGVECGQRPSLLTLWTSDEMSLSKGERWSAGRDAGAFIRGVSVLPVPQEISVEAVAINLERGVDSRENVAAAVSNEEEKMQFRKYATDRISSV
ncbi:hypothetical protein EBH_0059830 [Eimeria brunetti]|uniref:Uncharacterized protein n=1 Tax=Eimeria brunetti TaxID=51314 RepID=U6LZ03_9EIME|nr:hypothetical protein EBH_0059830 [Eimeria brunetti]